MSSRVVIPSRFNGPPNSGNGGYSCGVLGAAIGGAAEVTLKSPPPLDRELHIEASGLGSARKWEMLDGEGLVATGRAHEPDVVCPEPLNLERAKAAEAAYIGFESHPFPTCFVCGPDRAPDDGLRLFTGKVEGRDIVASTWTPSQSVGAADGTVEGPVVWSALDCPTYFGGRLSGYGGLAVLGRLAIKQVAKIRVGVPHVVVGWPLGKDGRKWEGAAAVFTAEGELCAFSRGLWVELKH